MSMISSVSHARKTWLTAATTSLAIITLSCVVGVLSTPLAAFITAATCSLVTASGVALARAARKMDTIFAEELGGRAVKRHRRAG
jgi:hypothetical protein